MDPTTLAAMGGELRAARRARGLTRVALADAVGSRPVIVGRWERGEAVPTPEQARALAEVLALSPVSAADWAAAAAEVVGRPGSEPGEGWRLPGRGAGTVPVPAERGAPGGSPAPAPAPDAYSYLDDPAEQRRYSLRWALTLVILGALAVCLIWALGELTEGWRALVDLFRGGPPPGDPAGAWGLVAAV